MSNDKGKKSDSENSMHDTQKMKGKTAIEKHMESRPKAKKPKMKK